MIREKARYSNLSFLELIQRRPFGVARLLPLRTLISRKLHFRRTWPAQTQRNLHLSVLQRRHLERIKGADFGVFDTEFPQKPDPAGLPDTSAYGELADVDGDGGGLELI